jgi:DTW domain-containing protein
MGKTDKKGKRKTQDPCEICFLHRTRCICASIPCLRLGTKLSLIIHHRELKRTTNTGMLAVRALPNSQVIIRGRSEEATDLRPLLETPNYQSVLLYPSQDAVVLTPELVEKSPLPLQLIVPDGNWRQASKVHYRHSELKGLTRVMVAGDNTDRYHLRAESRPDGMATLQAIAHAMGVIEGEAVKSALLRLYSLKLTQTLSGRGKAVTID